MILSSEDFEIFLKLEDIDCLGIQIMDKID